MENKNHFHVVDYIVFAATLVASLSIGLLFAFRKQKGNNSRDYFFGGGKLNVLPVALSLVVTFQSSLMILGDSAETYAYGMHFGMRVPGIFISYVLGAMITVPIFHPLKITSIYKYFSMRFGSNDVRFLAAAAGSMYLVFYMAIITVGTSIALTAVMGLPYWVTIITYTAITTVYTSLGGFKAVIWTDVFQFVVVVTGIIATLTRSTIEAGGPSAFNALSNGRFEISDIRLDPTIRHTIWSTSIGSITQFMIIFFSQMGLQRISATPNTKTAYIMVAITTPVYCLFLLLVSFEGVAIFAYYSSIGCEPLASGRISNINQIIPMAVIDLFGHMPGFPGLFIASLSSAALSSLSSCLTALSSVTFEDIIKVKFGSISDQTATKLAKIVVFIYGGLSLGLAFLLTLVPGGVTAIFQSFMGSIDGPTCGIFILSIFFLRATPKGVIIGGISGMVLSMILNLGQTFLGTGDNEYLPLGPTDRCPTTNGTTISTMLNMSVVSNSSYNTPFGKPYAYRSSAVHSTNVYLNYTTATDPAKTEEQPNVLKTIFGISFMWFSLIGFITTIIVGILVSLCCKRQADEKVHHACIYPLPDKFCALFPNGFFYSKTEHKAADKDRVKEVLMNVSSDKVFKDVFERDDPL